MSRIRLSGHAKRRIEERGIAVEAVIDTIFSPSHELYDTKEDTLIYVSEEHRPVVIAVHHPGNELYVVTVIPVSNLESLVSRRIRSGRWIPLDGGTGRRQDNRI